MAKKEDEQAVLDLAQIQADLDHLQQEIAAALASGGMHSASIAVIRTDLAELTHDITALAALLGKQLGEPIKSLADKIVSARQT